jgi:hypothetical protein
VGRDMGNLEMEGTYSSALKSCEGGGCSGESMRLGDCEAESCGHFELCIVVQWTIEWKRARGKPGFQMRGILGSVRCFQRPTGTSLAP